MTKLLRRLAAVRFPDYTFPLALLGASILCYGLLIPWLGFYWDDWAFVYISQKLGTAGLARYFATNRPVWGLLYQLTTALLGAVPWRWQVFGLVWHWLSAVALWRLARLLWPRYASAAAWISLLFVLYPGFDQQPIAITYGHFFIVLTAFFLSLCCTVLSLRRPRAYWIYTLLGLLLSAMNLLMMEYFFLLELVRPLLIWLVLTEDCPNWRERLARLHPAALRLPLLRAAPYLGLFVLSVVWRAFFFRFQTQNYEPVLLNQLRSQPLVGLLHLAGAMLRDFWVTTLAAWGSAFRLPDTVALGARTAQLTVGLTILALLLFLGYLLRFKPARDDGDAGWALPAVAVGGLGLLVAGWPFWLTGLQVSLIYPNSRFSLSYVLGASFLLAGLLRLLPLRSWMRVGLLAVLAAAAVNMHFQDANSFRRDFNIQKSLFWQLSWRMPGIEPGTALLFDDMPFQYSSDNTLTAPLNWIYAGGNHTDKLAFELYYPTVRIGRGLPALQPDLPIEQNYLAAWFSGSTSNTVAVEYQPPACVRVLDAVETTNAMLPVVIREAAGLSNLDRIQAANPQPVQPSVQIFGAEPAHNWCYYFEKADLARQQGDWAQVARLGDQAFKLADYPNDPTERMPFIEGYAHTGSWQRAEQLTQDSRAITPLMQPVLCKLWQRIDQASPASAEKEAAVKDVQGLLGCSD